MTFCSTGLSAYADLLHKLRRRRVVPIDEMWPRLLGKPSITLNYNFFDCLHCPDAAGIQGVVKSPIAAIDHIWLGHVIAVDDSRVDIAIDMHEPRFADLLKRCHRRLFKCTADEFQIIEAGPLNDTLKFVITGVA
jgi:hypothetical protein